MDQGVAAAARTIAVLSSAYTDSVYGAAGWRAAWASDPTGAIRKLLVARVEDCPRPGLLGQIVGIDLHGIPQEQARTDLLRAADLAVTGARAKPAAPPPFPTSGGRAVPTAPAFPTAAPGRPAANPPGDAGDGRITHHGDNHVSGLPGSGDGPVVGVNYGTVQHHRDSGS